LGFGLGLVFSGHVGVTLGRCGEVRREVVGKGGEGDGDDGGEGKVVMFGVAEIRKGAEAWTGQHRSRSELGRK
jgi:hypothetical protein